LRSIAAAGAIHPCLSIDLGDRSLDDSRAHPRCSRSPRASRIEIANLTGISHRSSHAV